MIQTTRPAQHRGGFAPAAAIVALTGCLSLLWSHVRLMWNDEFLSFYSDSAASLWRVFEIQLHSPISLDPPTYHLLSHLSMDAIGQSGMALRLPALAGFLLLQVSLFVLVRRLAGVRAGLVGMLFPLLTASFRYSVEGRPYGLLLGLYAASLLCWFTAADRDSRRGRALPLAGLALAIALAVTSHYFGVLILVPVSLGELARTVCRRRFDRPIVGALAAGVASIALVLPFQRALLPYRQHYYINSVNLRNISQGYREIFLRYNVWPAPWQRVSAAALAAATVALAIAAVRRFRLGPDDRSDSARALWIALWTALAAFAALPFFGYLFGKFVTHTMEVRYVIATLVAFAVALALVLERRLQSTRFFNGLVTAMLVAAAVAGTVQIRSEQRASQAILDGFTVPPALAAELGAHPAERLYTQSLNDLFLDSYYAPSPLVRSRITLLYDEASEVGWLHHNTNTVTAMYLQRFSTLATAPYASFLAQPAPLLLEYGSGWEWVGRDLEARELARQPLGAALHGELERVQTGNSR